MFKKGILVPLLMVVWSQAIHLMFLSFCSLIYKMVMEKASTSEVAVRIKCFVHESA